METRDTVASMNDVYKRRLLGEVEREVEWNYKF